MLRLDVPPFLAYHPANLPIGRLLPTAVWAPQTLGIYSRGATDDARRPVTA